MSARGNSSKDATYDTSDGSSGSCCCTILLVLLLQAQTVSSVNRVQADGEDVSDIVIFFVEFPLTKPTRFVLFSISAYGPSCHLRWRREVRKFPLLFSLISVRRKIQLRNWYNRFSQYAGFPPRIQDGKSKFICPCKARVCCLCLQPTERELQGSCVGVEQSWKLLLC